MRFLSSTTGAIISTGSCWSTSANLTSAGNVAQEAMRHPGDSQSTLEINFYQVNESPAGEEALLDLFLPTNIN